MVNFPWLTWDKLVVLARMDFSSPDSSDPPLLGHKLQNEGRMKSKEQETMQKTQVTEHEGTADIKDKEGK